MTHLKLQKLKKGDYPPAHRLSVNVLLSNITFFVIFAVLDVSRPVTRVQTTVFLHLYLQFYYVSVALPCSGYVVYGTVYVVRIIFEVLP